MGVRLAILILSVDDVAASVRFYRDAFGWTPVVDVPVYAELATGGDCHVGLYDRARSGINTGAPPLARPGGGTTATELYLQVDDLDAAEAALVRAGAQPLSPRAPRTWGDEASYFADPDGNVIAVARPLTPGAPSGS